MTENKSAFERLANAIFAIPAVAQFWAKRSAGRTADLVDLSGGIPFTLLKNPLAQCRVALITTAGVHLRWQPPFDMNDPDGDATFREIPANVDPDDLTITHKYYDHRDADRDLNIVFPLEHLRDLVNRGILGASAPRHFGFMGHIDGPHIDELNRRSADAVAAKLHDDQVDFALLTPA